MQPQEAANDNEPVVDEVADTPASADAAKPETQAELAPANDNSPAEDLPATGTE